MASTSTTPNVNVTGSSLRVRITIPAAGGRLRDLVVAAEPSAPRNVAAIYVLGKLSNGTDRGAFVVADPRPGQEIAAGDYSSHGQSIGAGEAYNSPSAGDYESYVQGADIPAVIVLFW